MFDCREVVSKYWWCHILKGNFTLFILHNFILNMYKFREFSLPIREPQSQPKHPKLITKAHTSLVILHRKQKEG